MHAHTVWTHDIYCCWCIMSSHTCFILDRVPSTVAQEVLKPTDSMRYCLLCKLPVPPYYLQFTIQNNAIQHSTTQKTTLSSNDVEKLAFWIMSHIKPIQENIPRKHYFTFSFYYFRSMSIFFFFFMDKKLGTSYTSHRWEKHTNQYPLPDLPTLTESD